MVFPEDGEPGFAANELLMHYCNWFKIFSIAKDYGKNHDLLALGTPVCQLDSRSIYIYMGDVCPIIISC